jgi:hypothetical protein
MTRGEGFSLGVFFFRTIGNSYYFQRGHGLLLSFLSADPLCMARWSVVSLLIKYCGSSFEARTV